MIHKGLFYYDGKIVGKHDILDWIVKDAKECASISETYLKLDLVQTFLQNFAKVYTDYITVSSFNKARYRRSLPALFKEFAMLSDEGAALDFALARHLKMVCY